jgi:small subunit ribosomal protein S6
MRAYELMVIVDGALEESVVDQVLQLVRDQVSTAGATIVKVDKWGKRRFAYEINHKLEGYYLVAELTNDGAGTLDAMERSLRLSDDVVRHKLIRLPDREATRRGLIGAVATAET